MHSRQQNVFIIPKLYHQYRSQCRRNRRETRLKTKLPIIKRQGGVCVRPRIGPLRHVAEIKKYYCHPFGPWEVLADRLGHGWSNLTHRRQKRGTSQQVTLEKTLCLQHFPQTSLRSSTMLWGHPAKINALGTLANTLIDKKLGASRGPRSEKFVSSLQYQI